MTYWKSLSIPLTLAVHVHSSVDFTTVGPYIFTCFGRNVHDLPPGLTVTHIESTADWRSRDWVTSTFNQPLDLIDVTSNSFVPSVSIGPRQRTVRGDNRPRGPILQVHSLLGDTNLGPRIDTDPTISSIGKSLTFDRRGKPKSISHVRYPPEQLLLFATTCQPQKSSVPHQCSTSRLPSELELLLGQTGTAALPGVFPCHR